MMKSLVVSLAALLLSTHLAAADAPPAPAPTVPPEVLAEAAHIADLAKAKAAAGDPPLPETLKTADEVDAQLIACRVLLDQQEPTKAGQSFVSAVNALQGLPRAERKALGARYQQQRQQLLDLAQRLLADPAVAAALDVKDDAPAATEAPAKPAPEIEAKPEAPAAK